MKLGGVGEGVANFLNQSEIIFSEITPPYVWQCKPPSLLGALPSGLGRFTDMLYPHNCAIAMYCV